MPASRLLAVSDLHVRYPENRAIVEGLRPASDGDWLIVAGDVAERVDDVVGTLTLLRERFATVVWVPGNHELWTRPKEGVGLRGEERYRHLVQECRAAGVLTPEDPFPVWTGEGGPAVVAPLFLLYDYSFLPDGTATAEEGLAAAYNAGVVCTDEHLLAPDPYPDRAAWCAARVAYSRARLDACDSGPADGAGQPLAADPAAHAGTAVSRVRAVVRHDGHRRLARPLPRHRRRLRPPAHPARDLGGRGAVRRGVAGLPARMAGPRRPGSAAADGAAGAALNPVQ